MKRVFTLLLLLFATGTTNAQGNAYPKKPLTKKTHALAGGRSMLVRKSGTGFYDNVHSAFQDKSGNLWFATTNDGVYRYDGKSFTNFTTTDGLFSNTVYSILQDKAGNIWFGCDGGLGRYDGRTFTAVPITTDFGNYFVPDKSANSKYATTSLLLDKNGRIWVGTSKGVYIYNGFNFTHFLSNDSVANPGKLKLNFVQSMLQDRKGNIWFTTWFEGVCCYDGKTVTSFKPNGEVWFAGLAADKSGNIWVGRRDKGACRYDGKSFTNILQNGPFDSCGVQAITADKAGNIWFGTEAGELVQREKMGGVWCYNGKSFKNYTTRDGLPDYSVFCILEDRTGNMWFGTRNTGLCRYDGKNITNFSAAAAN